MALVTLVLAAGPGFPAGSPGHRYELEVALDPSGHPDAAAWAADPAPWVARRLRPGAPELEGDVQHDPETGGWSLRFFPAGSQPAEPVATPLLHADASLRPGEHVTVREPDGVEFAYRVVSVA